MRVKRFLVMVLMVVTAFIAVSGASAATSYTPPTAATQPARFQVQGTIVSIGRGWVEMRVTRVEQGTGLKVNTLMRLAESSKTRVLQSGKPVQISVLKKGASVDAAGRAVKGKSGMIFQATAITILGK